GRATNRGSSFSSHERSSRRCHAIGIRWPPVSNATWLEAHTSIAEHAQTAWRGQASAQSSAWSRARIASSVAMGWAVALLVYAGLQLSMAAGWTFAELGAGTIPLFFRWRVACMAGAFGAFVSCVADVNRRSPRLPAWTLFVGVIAVALVVVLAP